MKKDWNWMTNEEREEAEERAAIMQYHGALTPERAEFLAIDRIYRQREHHTTPVGTATQSERLL